MQTRLSISAQVVLDSSGNGTATAGPTSQGEQWLAGFVVSVHVSDTTDEAVCRVYLGGSASPACFCDGTTWGSTGDSTSNTSLIGVGSSVFAVWTGGTPGATAYMNITGTRVV